MIRPAAHEDIPALLDMGERFIEKAWSRVHVPFDRETCSDLLAGLIEQENGILLTDDERSAMFGAVIHPWHFNRNVLTGTELFWWAEPGCKTALAMKAEGERLAKALGAKTFNMAHQHHMRGAALERLYRRQGYEPSEHIYIKEL